MLNPSSVQAARYSVSSGRNVDDKADTLYEMIKKELDFTEKAKEKFNEIRQALAKFKQLLQSDEIKVEEKNYVQEYIVALESLPASKGFKKKNCNDYQVQEKAKKLLESLCD